VPPEPLASSRQSASVIAMHRRSSMLVSSFVLAVSERLFMCAESS
jgi:hypothetical protein